MQLSNTVYILKMMIICLINYHHWETVKWRCKQILLSYFLLLSFFFFLLLAINTNVWIMSHWQWCVWWLLIVSIVVILVELSWCEIKSILINWYKFIDSLNTSLWRYFFRQIDFFSRIDENTHQVTRGHSGKFHSMNIISSVFINSNRWSRKTRHK